MTACKSQRELQNFGPAAEHDGLAGTILCEAASTAEVLTGRIKGCDLP